MTDQTPMDSARPEVLPSPEAFRTTLRPLELFVEQLPFIVRVTGLLIVLTLVVLVLLPDKYASTTVLLPATQDNLSSLAAGLSGLASVAGLNVGASNPEITYPAIINSESVLREVIYREYRFTMDGSDTSANLIQYWEIEEDTPEEDYEVALEQLRKELGVSVDKETYLITISLATKYPKLSADALNQLTSSLDTFLRTKRTTTATEQRRWIDSRLQQVERDLAKSETNLKDFREKNRRVMDSPELLLEQERLLRDVTINATLYTELKKQLELVKIEEIKNIPVISVMDEARPLARHTSPRRGILIIVCSVLYAAVVSILAIVLRARRSEIMTALAVLSNAYVSMARRVPLLRFTTAWVEKRIPVQDRL